MDTNPNSPLHGLTLEMILNALVERHGWEAMGKAVDIRCFNRDPSVKSSLAFLRKTPWARAKVEAMYLAGKAEPARKRAPGGRPAGGGPRRRA